MNKKMNMRQFWMCISILCVLFCFSGCGREEELIFFSDEAAVDEISGEAEGNDEEGVAADTGEMVVVYICGAVKAPGVYTLPPGSRLNDAVSAAGGFAENAAVTSVNLAARIMDEEMIYVKTKEEAETQDLAERSDTDSEPRININTADVYTLCRLPGIGESKARDIVTYREKNGIFQKKEDIMQVNGIKENLYEKICDLISVK